MRFIELARDGDPEVYGVTVGPCMYPVLVLAALEISDGFGIGGIEGLNVGVTKGKPFVVPGCVGDTAPLRPPSGLQKPELGALELG